MSPHQRSARSNVRRLAVGRLISITGGAAAYTALNFTVWDRTHSPGMQALSLLLTFGVTGLLGPLAGALGDRFDRRKVMVWSEGVAAVFFLVMALLDSPGWLIALAFGSAIAELPFYSASRAAIPNLVESDDQIAWANSLITVGSHSGIALGPVIGGVLLWITGPSWVFAINGISFLVSLWLTLTVTGRFQTREKGSEEHEGLSAGLRFMWREPVIRRMTVAWFVFLLGMGMGMVADAALAESFEAGPIGFGLLIAFWGTGSVAGSLAGRWMTPKTEPVWLVVGAFGIALAAFGVGVAPVFPLVLVSLLLMGTSDGFTMVSENGIMQRRTPDVVRSRTMAAFDAVLSVGLAIAYLLAGPVLKAVGPQGAYVIGGATALLAAITLVPLLKLRHQEGAREPEPKPAPEPARFASAEGLDAAQV